MTKFSDLKLDPKVLQAIAEAGYETPTPIQAGAIPPALEGRDVLGIAQTGTGKTASFTLPMITLLGRGRARARMPRSLVLCPTRELAAQVAENFDIYAKHTRLTKALLIGGVSFGEQDKLIDRGVDVLIATPGRLLDHFERGKLLLTGVQIMVVDEADRMLDMGFIPDIERIFQLTPFTRQTLFFSATMAPEIERITNTFLHAPERIEVARQATTSETITQKLVELTPTRKDQTAKQKRELLRALIDAEGPETETGGLKNAIIFCNRKTEVDIVAKSLKAHGYDAAPIHGDLDQRVRTATLDGFRDGSLRFLVASDVAARGLDIPAVSHVFNFDLPSHAEDYVHRIGRTGRAGRLGTAYSIATPSDEKYLAAIENLVKHALPRVTLPDGFRVSESAQSAPRPQPERGERGGRSTSRTRSRRSGPRDEAPVAETVETTADAAPAQARSRGERPQEDRRERPAPAPEARPAVRRDDPPHEARSRDDRRDDRRREDRPREDRPREDRPRDDRRDDRRDRNRDRGPSVLGMGDHVPEFLLTSFAEAIAATDARAAAARPEPEPEAAEDAPRTEAAAAPEPAGEAETAVPATQPDAKPRRATRSRSRRRKDDVTDPADAAASAPASGEATGETADAPAHKDAAAAEPTAVATPDAPAKPKRTRARRKPKAAEADAAIQSPADAEIGSGLQAAAAVGDDADAATPAAPQAGAVLAETPALPEERDALAEDAAAGAVEVVPPVPSEELEPDALPEERDATQAADDGSVNLAPVGEDTADEPRHGRETGPTVDDATSPTVDQA